MTRWLPLLGERDPDAPLAWQQGQPISAARFVAEVQQLARALPATGPAVNLCHDRYHFALGLGAALLRGHTSLMPPNALPETLRRLQLDGSAPYALADEAGLDIAGLQRVAVGRPSTVDAGAARTAAIDGGLQAVCLLTSGSTGAPQPHLKRWQALVHNIAAEAERLAALMQRPSLAGLTIVATVPPQHSYGFESSVLLALLGGASFDSGRPFYPADIVAALQRLPRPRALVTTPFHLKTLLRSGITLPVVDLVLSATAPLSPQLAADAERQLQGRLIEIYGCTEAGQVATRRTTDGEVWTTLGELRLWREVQGGDERFLVAGGHVTEPTPLADVLDLLDEHRFRLLGRAGDLIHVAGKRSSLAHLNFHLNRIDGVLDGAFWLPDDVADGVVRPIAFVVAPTLNARQVITALRQQLEPTFVPRRVVLLPELPREATGKITVAKLRQLAARHAADDAPAAAPPDTRFDIGADHPAFDGHFPGLPILPGVVLMSLVLQAVHEQPAWQQRLGATPVIDAVKFLAPVRPGCTLRVALAALGQGLGFEVWDGARCVARGKLVAGRA